MTIDAYRRALVRRRDRARTVLGYCRRSDRVHGRCDGDLDGAFVAAVLSAPCSYCLAADLPMTLDRVDNAEPHTRRNCVGACIRCNYVRGSMPYAAWLCLVPGIREALDKGLFGDWRARPIATTRQDVQAIEDVSAALAALRSPRSTQRASRIAWPSTESLRAEVASSSLSAVARRLGCTHAAVGVRIGRYPPGRARGRRNGSQKSG